MTSGLDIGTLSGRIELEDGLSPVLDLSSISVEKFEQMFGHMGNTVAEQAASFFTAEAAIKAVEEALHLGAEAIKDMTIEGAGLAGIEQNFDRLTAGAGQLGATLLGELRSGTKNTIDDFSLMKTVNQDLTAGLNLTSDQYKLVAQSAFALAKAQNTDVKSAMESVNDALVTGRARGIAYLTGRLDLTAAERQFAEAAGHTADQLTPEGRLLVDRQTILEALTKSSARLGDQTVMLNTSIQQLQTKWNNWYDDLAKTVATSPHMVVAFESIGEAIQHAFGSDTESVRNAIVGWINNLADKVAEYGPRVVNGIMDIRDWLLKVYNTTKDTWDALPDWFKNVAERSALATAGIVALDKGAGSLTSTVAEVATAASGFTKTLTGMPALFGLVKNAAAATGEAIEGIAFVVWTKGAAAGLEAVAGAAAAAVGPLGLIAIAAGAIFAAWEIGKLAPVSAFFEKIGLEIQGFSSAEADAAMAASHAADGIKQQSAAAEDLAAKLKKVADAQAAEAASRAAANIEASNAAKIAKTETEMFQFSEAEKKKMKEAQDELNASGKTWQETVSMIVPEVATEAEMYLKAGVSASALMTIYGLTANQVKALGLANEDLKKSQDLLTKSMEDSKLRWAEYADGLAKLSGSTLAIQLADNDKWVAGQIKAHVLAKTDTADFYNWLDTMSKLHVQQAKADAESIGKTDSEKAWAFADQTAEAYRQAMIAMDNGTANFSKDTLNAMDAAATAATQAAITLDKTMGSELVKLADQAEELHKVLKAGFSYDVSSANFSQQVSQFHLDPGGAFDLAKKGYSFQEIVEYLGYGAPSGPLPPPQGPKIPGFKDGGIGDFGAGTLAMLHGPEAIIPLDQVGPLGGGVSVVIHPGAVVMNYPLLSDPRAKDQFGRMIGSVLVDRARNLGKQVG